jgi:hypothetical protein
MYEAVAAARIVERLLVIFASTCFACILALKTIVYICVSQIGDTVSFASSQNRLKNSKMPCVIRYYDRHLSKSIFYRCHN